MIKTNKVWGEHALNRKYIKQFSSGVETGDHSYCFDFGKSLLKTFSASNSPHFLLMKLSKNLKLRNVCSCLFQLTAHEHEKNMWDKCCNQRWKLEYEYRF